VRRASRTKGRGRIKSNRAVADIKRELEKHKKAAQRKLNRLEAELAEAKWDGGEDDDLAPACLTGCDGAPGSSVEGSEWCAFMVSGEPWDNCYANCNTEDQQAITEGIQQTNCKDSRGGKDTSDGGGAGAGGAGAGAGAGGSAVNELAEDYRDEVDGTDGTSVLWKPLVTPYIHKDFTRQAQRLLSGGTLTYLIAGLFNTGTNLAYNELLANCPRTRARGTAYRGEGEFDSKYGSSFNPVFPDKTNITVEWQAWSPRVKHRGMPWFNGTGKHSFLGIIDREAVPCDETCKEKGVPRSLWQTNKRIGEPRKLVLPSDKSILLMVKHPLHWLHSCCTGRSYSIKIRQKKEGLCATSRMYKRVTPFQDMVEMWNRWHSAYFDSGLPVTWLRYEDLLFTPDEIITDMCNVEEGESIVEEKAAKHHKANETGRSGALRKYGNSGMFKEFFESKKVCGDTSSPWTDDQNVERTLCYYESLQQIAPSSNRKCPRTAPSCSISNEYEYIRQNINRTLLDFLGYEL
jgi:hypothetical protein